MKKFIKKIRAWGRGVNHLYSKLVILYCIAFASFLCLYALFMMHDTGYDASSIITVGVGFFGGELLCVCLKSVFDGKKNKGEQKDKNEDEEAVG